MFTIKRVYRGEVFPLSIIQVAQTGQLIIEATLRIQATLSDETLTVRGLNAAISFHVGATTYPFPLTGADFLTAQDGALHLLVRQALTPGLYKFAIETLCELPGACGYFPAGYGRAADLIPVTSATTAFLVIQQLPYSVPVSSQAFPYTVPIGTV